MRIKRNDEWVSFCLLCTIIILIRIKLKKRHMKQIIEGLINYVYIVFSSSLNVSFEFEFVSFFCLWRKQFRNVDYINVCCNRISVKVMVNKCDFRSSRAIFLMMPFILRVYLTCYYRVRRGRKLFCFRFFDVVVFCFILRMKPTKMWYTTKRIHNTHAHTWNVLL